MCKETIEFIEENKIVAICRGTYGNELINLVTALERGGVRLVEVTFDQNDEECLTKTPKAINELSQAFKGKVSVGAGTVVTVEQVDAAYKAGAKYIISPNTNAEVIKHTKKLGLVSIPGALTPSEILAAHDAGADFVKVFPVGSLGLGYVKDIRGPINHVKLLATAGGTPDNLADYLNGGFSGAGISNYLTNKKHIAAGDYDVLTEHARELVQIVSAVSQ